MLKPKDWKPGMTVRCSVMREDYVLLRRLPADACPDGKVWKTECGHCLWDNQAHTRSPATYADLDREPVEGERAVKVSSHPTAFLNETDVGDVQTINSKQACGTDPTWVSIWGDRFAPLAEHPLKKGLVSAVILNEKPTPECEKPHGHAKCERERNLACACLWLLGTKCDPCQPCAALIDLADYWNAWYAGCCRHGWRSGCKECAR